LSIPGVDEAELHRFNTAYATTNLLRNLAAIRLHARRASAILQWTRQPTTDQYWNMETVQRIANRLARLHDDLHEHAEDLPDDAPLGPVLADLEAALGDGCGNPIRNGRAKRARIHLSVQGALRAREPEPAKKRGRGQ
jgi:hypothetical protein